MDIIENKSNDGRIWVSIERTINLGNYENKKYQVGVSFENPFKLENKTDAIKEVNTVLNYLEKLLEHQIESKKGE